MGENRFNGTKWGEVLQNWVYLGLSWGQIRGENRGKREIFKLKKKGDVE